MKKNDLRHARERQRRRENRETILHAAEAVVLRKGVSAASMDDVAAEAQFSKTTLYRYFKNKAALVFEIVFHFMEDIDLQLRAVRARDTSARERLADGIAETLRLLAEKENLTRLFILDRSFMKLLQIFVSRQNKPGLEDEKKFVQKIRVKRRELIDGTAEVLRAGMASGEFRTMDVDAAVTYVGAVIQGYFVEKFWEDRKSRIDEDAARIVDFVIHGIEKKQSPTEGGAR